MTDPHSEWVLILDFGSQYTQLIARCAREQGVYSKIYPHDIAGEKFTKTPPKAVILSGGAESATVPGAPVIPVWVFSLGVPLLGVCYGMQALAKQCGGRVVASSLREFGQAKVRLMGRSPLFSSLTADTLDVWMSHGDRIEKLPEGFQAIACNDHAPVAAMADEKRRWYGVQFHPEVTHTEDDNKILKQFLHKIAGCSGLWRPDAIIGDITERLEQQVGKEKVLLAVSGGVDSTVAAVLLKKALGKQLSCVFVDNGLLRLNEVEQVSSLLDRHVGEVTVVDAAERFLADLAGISDPEKKRKRIGHTFIEVFEEAAHKFRDIHWLAQGTIYPDVIESAAAGSGKAHVIKSHHNVGGLPARMRLKLVEPLKELFKDEVRSIGVSLGLPAETLYRHPFPGPGLAVRVLGKVRKSYLKKLREADAIFIDALVEAGWYEKVAQAFAVFLPVRSVGVVGDARQYEHVISLRAVETVDFMTARAARLPGEFLEEVANRIINRVHGISRVTYDISSKPPATIEWE